jgi:predicted nucleic acid-binding protein
MATKVLDSWALMAFFEDEPAAEQVEKLLAQAAADKHKLLLSVVNWGEIYYNTMREVSQEAAEQKAREIATLPIDIVGVAEDLRLARQAAIFKATHKMSYADCFAAALAKSKNAELVTGDPEFKSVEGDVKVSWLATK